MASNLDFDPALLEEAKLIIPGIEFIFVDEKIPFGDPDGSVRAFEGEVQAVVFIFPDIAVGVVDGKLRLQPANGLE